MLGFQTPTLSLCFPQTKPGVISSVSGLNLGKGPLQIQVVGKGLSQLVPSVQSQQLVSSRGNECPPQHRSAPGEQKCFSSLTTPDNICFLPLLVSPVVKQLNPFPVCVEHLQPSQLCALNALKEAELPLAQTCSPTQLLSPLLSPLFSLSPKYDSKLGSLKKTPTLQPSKEAW